MKRVHIISIVLIIVAIGALLIASKDVSTYGTFAEARSESGKVKIAGELAKDKEMMYNPEIDPNYFSFYLVDQNGEEQKVILQSAKPQDFEMSEQIVVTGQWHEQDFVANSVLLKCPSKYKDEEIFVKDASSI